MDQYQWPTSFKRIATAVTFSPTALAVLHEAIRITKRLNAYIYFIHAGVKTEETEKKLRELLTQANCEKENYRIIWKDEEPTTAILDACKENDIDLLIAGALQKENLVQYYRGSVARKLCRKANCSLMLLTHPEIESRPCERIMVNGLKHPKTNDTVQTAFYMANAFGAKEVTIVEEVDPADIGINPDDDLKTVKANRKKAQIARNEHLRLEAMLKELPISKNIRVKERCVFGKKGYSIGHYAEKNKADLLVMNSPDTKLGFFDRVFTHDLEYVLADLPTDLLLVHTTRKKEA